MGIVSSWTEECAFWPRISEVRQGIAVASRKCSIINGDIWVPEVQSLACQFGDKTVSLMHLNGEYSGRGRLYWEHSLSDACGHLQACHSFSKTYTETKYPVMSNCSWNSLLLLPLYPDPDSLPPLLSHQNGLLVSKKTWCQLLFLTMRLAVLPLCF